jgi:hypothetical protein
MWSQENRALEVKAMRLFWIINLVLFQASWFCAAFFTQYANQVMPLLLIVHFLLSPTRLRDFRLLILLPIGILADKFQMEIGMFGAGEGIFPLWLLLLWAMFILSLNHSLAWLQGRSITFLAIVGAFGGTSSYWAGIQAGVIEPLMPMTMVLFCLVLVWAFVLPLLVNAKSVINPPFKVKAMR